MSDACVTRNPTPPGSCALVIRCADIHTFSHAIGVDMRQIRGTVSSAKIDTAKVKEFLAGAGNCIERIVSRRAFG